MGSTDASRAANYVILATPRSGSYMVCDLLRSTGLAGSPHEYLGRHVRDALAERWGCGAALPDYLAAVRDNTRSRTGVVGIKAMWRQLCHSVDSCDARAAADQIESVLGPCRYVWLRR